MRRLRENDTVAVHMPGSDPSQKWVQETNIESNPFASLPTETPSVSYTFTNLSSCYTFTSSFPCSFFAHGCRLGHTAPSHTHTQEIWVHCPALPQTPWATLAMSHWTRFSSTQLQRNYCKHSFLVLCTEPRGPGSQSPSLTIRQHSLQDRILTNTSG